MGLETAIVADLGVAEADRVAALMEVLWPEPGCGKHCVGSSGKGAFACVIWRTNSAPYAFFAGFQLGEPSEQGIPTTGHSVNCPRPMSALGIAMAHQREFAPMMITKVFAFEGEQEAIEHLQVMRAKMTPEGLAFM